MLFAMEKFRYQITEYSLILGATESFAVLCWFGLFVSVLLCAALRCSALRFSKYRQLHLSTPYIDALAAIPEGCRDIHMPCHVGVLVCRYLGTASSVFLVVRL